MHTSRLPPSHKEDWLTESITHRTKERNIPKGLGGTSDREVKLEACIPIAVP